jgi:penicillin-binding protein 1A
MVLRWIARLVKFFTVLGVVGVIILVAVFAYYYQETELDADKLINYAPNVSSEILDRHGKRLAFIFKGRHRLYATYDEIPPYLIEALVAIEDTKFFEHNGVNPDAILRAIVRDIRARRFVEGGSTITQQLIKITLLSSKKKLERKIREAILALKIEHRLTKEQILERYLNEIPYGNNYFGVKTAAQGYFHKELKALTLKESVLLVGLPNAPSYYNPLRHYKRALNRANAILYRMKSLGWITEREYIQASKETPSVYRTTLTQNVAPYIVDELLRRFKGRFGDIRTGGYTIYTTIDVGMQAIARDAVKSDFERIVQRFGDDVNTTKLNGALVAVENTTGDILALVGGVDYRKSAFNRVTMTRRQPGSAFKPFVYQTALDMGYNPATKLTDLARTFQYTSRGRKKVWAPRNYERNYKGFITLREALVHSRNLATVNLVYDIGVETIRKRLALLDVPNVPKDLSIALGNLGLSPLKMAQIYTVFSNQGHMIEPRLVSKIVSKEGAVLFETFPKEIANFTQPEQAYLMTDILRDIVRRGTGRNAQVEGIELAGKTGTTNNGVDAWFCGYSPSVTTIVWYGRDNNRPIGKRATGGSVAAPAFAEFYRKMLELYPDTPRHFERPDGVMEGKVTDGSELYTTISPLPNRSTESSKGIVEMFDHVAAPVQPENDSVLIEQSESDTGDMEVIRIDDEPVMEETITSQENNKQPDPESIDPLNLKPKRPQPVGDDSGSMF